LAADYLIANENDCQPQHAVGDAKLAA
jgi:hypothetical protein